MEDMTQEIDPRFFIPPFVTGVEYKTKQEPSSDGPEQDEVSVVDVEYVLVDDLNGELEDPSGYVDGARLLPPDYLTVVSQTARVTSGGTVVDVVINVEDVTGANDYEVRLSK